MASVEKRVRNGRVVYVGIPWDRELQKKGPKRHFKFECDAYQYARQWERDRDQFARSIGIDPERNRQRVLVSEFACKFAAQMTGTKGTRRTRLSTANQLAARWPKLYVHEITREHIVDYLAWLEQDGALEPSRPMTENQAMRAWGEQNGYPLPPLGRRVSDELAKAFWSAGEKVHNYTVPGSPRPAMAPGTIRKYHTFLTTMFAEAVHAGLIAESPCHHLPKRDRTRRRSSHIVNELELKAILDTVPEWMEAAVLLAHDLGFREAEVCGLLWQNVDFDNEEVTIVDVLEDDGAIRHYPKGKEQRIVPLTPRTIVALKQARLRQKLCGPRHHVLQQPTIGRATRPVTPHALCNWWRRNITLGKIPELLGRPTFHALRHAAAYRLVAIGINIEDLRDFMGHKSIATTQEYMPKGSRSRIRAVLRAAATFHAGNADVVAIA